MAQWLIQQWIPGAQSFEFSGSGLPVASSRLVAVVAIGCDDGSIAFVFMQNSAGCRSDEACVSPPTHATSRCAGCGTVRNFLRRRFDRRPMFDGSLAESDCGSERKPKEKRGVSSSLSRSTPKSVLCFPRVFVLCFASAHFCHF